MRKNRILCTEDNNRVMVLREEQKRMSDLLELIRSRKSVRTFEERPISAEDRDRLADYKDTISNPFGIPVRFVLLDAKENGLSSPVLSGEAFFAL